MTMRERHGAFAAVLLGLAALLLPAVVPDAWAPDAVVGFNEGADETGAEVAEIAHGEYIAAADPTVSGLRFNYYCHTEEDCPKRFWMFGFPVYVSPQLDVASATSEEQLGMALEYIRAQLSYALHPKRGIPPHAAAALRRADVSIYLGAETGDADDPWYPCGSGNGCWHTGAKRMGFKVGNVIEYHGVDNNVLHELAHAYHALVIVDGDRNTCISRAYQESVHDMGLYDEVRNQWFWSGRQPHDGQSTQRAYAATNMHEWFAETAEAYFLMNGAEPYDRHDLWARDKNAYAIHRFMWQNPDYCPIARFRY